MMHRSLRCRRISFSIKNAFFRKNYACRTRFGRSVYERKRAQMIRAVMEPIERVARVLVGGLVMVGGLGFVVGLMWMIAILDPARI